jgi:heat shock protein HslJ
MRFTRMRLVSLAVLAAALSACLERSATGPDPWRPNDVVLGIGSLSAPLVGTTWSLRELPDLSLGAARDSVRPLRFTRESAGQLALSTSLGCNTMGGMVDTVGTRLRVSSLYSTRIGCGDALATLETGYGTVLSEVAYFGVRADTLWLYDGGLRLRARYRAVR